MKWFRNGVPTNPLPFDLKDHTVFEVSEEMFRHELSLFVIEGGERVEYSVRTLLPYHYVPGECYCLALVDGKHGLWQCARPGPPGPNGEPAPIELMKPARWGVYQ